LFSGVNIQKVQGAGFIYSQGAFRPDFTMQCMELLQVMLEVLSLSLVLESFLRRI